jgi:uncharacterized protein (UPF0335 family)
MIGKNTVSGGRLMSFIERIEQVRSVKKQAGKDESAIMAEAKAEGFTPGAIRYVVKVREEKPHDRQEREAMQDLYLHAAGLATEPPLFRFAGLGTTDITARDQVIDRMKDFVPPAGKGHIDVTWAGVTFRLVRDKEGEVSASEVVAPDKKAEGSARTTTPAPRREPPPDVDAEGAEELGRSYARDNRPVIDNPFPFGDARRPRFDEGWRRETGSDGMGPDGMGPDDE